MTAPMQSVRETIAAARAGQRSTATAVGAYPSLERTACNLPAHLQVKLIRALIRESLSFSWGADKLHEGCDLIEDDLRAETLANDEPGIRQAVL